MTSNIISNFWRENSKRNFFDDFDTLCSSPDFVSFGHLAQIVCTSLAENEWYKKSFAWQSQGRKARFRNRQSPIGTEIWIGTKWLSVLSPPHRMNTILYPKCHWSLNSIHYSGYSFMNMTFFLMFKLYKIKYLWRHVTITLMKVCHNCEGISN